MAEYRITPAAECDLEKIWIPLASKSQFEPETFNSIAIFADLAQPPRIEASAITSSSHIDRNFPQA